MKKNLPLIVGIALPIIFIIIMSVVIFVPTMFVNPQYNFLYTLNDSYYAYNQGYRNSFSVVKGQVVPVPIPGNADISNPQRSASMADYPPLYVYDVKSNTSHAVTLDQARTFVLDPGPSSPDGYTVAYEYNDAGIFDLFGSRSNSGYFIEKGSSRKILTGMTANNMWSYSGNFKLIGWIK